MVLFLMVIQSLPAVADYPEYPSDRQVSGECGGQASGMYRGGLLDVLGRLLERAVLVR